MTTQLLGNPEVSLVDILDRLLDKGVVVGGDMTISVAEVDLIFASLRLVVTSVDKICENNAGSFFGGELLEPPGGGGECSRNEPHENTDANTPPVFDAIRSSPEHNKVNGAGSISSAQGLPSTCSAVEPDGGETNIDPDKAANGLAQLVLTVTDLLRKLLEREALRRMERGTLTHRQMEQVGKAFLRLEKKMQDIKDIFNLKDEDLNLNLGPLGKIT